MADMSCEGIKLEPQMFAVNRDEKPSDFGAGSPRNHGVETCVGRRLQENPRQTLGVFGAS